MKYYFITIPIILLLLLINFNIAYATYQAYTKEPIQSMEALPEATEASYSVITAEVTAYTLSVDETDGDPTMGACGNMDRIFNIIACPRSFDCGDIVEIDNIEYTCWDRMHIRNDGKFDILMPDKKSAFEWGRRIKEIKVYE